MILNDKNKYRHDCRAVTANITFDSKDNNLAKL